VKVLVIVSISVEVSGKVVVIVFVSRRDVSVVPVTET
jgi:hypothetical protein